MAKTEITGIERLQLSIPKRWIPKLQSLMDFYGALTIQDVIRTIIASNLFPEECHVEKVTS
jgi:hypothetical protein